MHDDGVGSGTIEMARLQSVVNGILAHRWKEGGILALALNPENHYHVSAFDRVFEMFLDAQTAFDEFREVVRHERARTSDTDCRPELCQQVNVRASHTRMQYVSYYRDVQSLNSALVLANG